MRRLHFSPLLALTLFAFVGFGLTASAQPELLQPPKVYVAQAKKVDEKVEAKAEEPKKKDEEVKKEEGGTNDVKENPWDAAVKEAKKAGDDAAAAGKQRGDTAWMLVASALVLLMVPGLALFYGGMVRKKNVLATMMQSYAAMAIVGLYWIAVGYSLAFGPSMYTVDWFGVKDGGLVGWSSDLFFLRGVSTQQLLPTYNIPVYVHVMFQGMFAIITPALISGALAERIRFWPFCIFMILWVTFVYCPLAHMVWAFDWFATVPVSDLKTADGGASAIGTSAIGLLGKMGALDFAGGTVVHIAAGMAGLACALVLRRRLGYPGHAIQPNSMVLTLIGAGLLWFGWFGFNGGSSLTSDPLGASAFSATQAAAAAAGLAWIFVEWIFKGKPTALGLASGIVAGLVAVTPASGFVQMWGGAAIGILAGTVCYFSVQLKSVLGYDDSLDAFGVHAVGGFLGAVLTGLFCYTAVNSVGADGYFAIKEHQSRLSELRKKFPDAPALAEIAEAEKAMKEKEAALETAKKDGKKDSEKSLTADVATAKADFDKKSADLKKGPGSKRIDEIDEELKKKDEEYKKAKTAQAEATSAYDTAADLGRKASEKGGADAEKTKDAFAKAKDEKDAKVDEYEKLAHKVNELNAEKKKLSSELEELTNQEKTATKLWADEKGPMTQFGIQLKAALFATAWAFALSLVLAIAVQVLTLGNFSTDKKSENEGLDLTEHGEIGFDLTVGYDSIPIDGTAEPKAAKVPPGQKRFEVVVEGIDNGGLIKAWSEMCQPTDQPIDPDFKAVYPFVTTVQGNRFRMRGGDSAKISASVQKLFSKKLGKPLKVRVEE